MAHHRGRDRALETRGRLASGPAGLIPAIKSRRPLRRPVRRGGVLSAGADSATTNASRTWCPAFAVPLEVFDYDHRHAYALRLVSADAQGSTSWPGAVLCAPSQTVFDLPVSTDCLGALALQERRPRWPPRDPRPP